MKLNKTNKTLIKSIGKEFDLIQTTSHNIYYVNLNMVF